MRSDAILKILHSRPDFLRRYRVELMRMLHLAERDVIDLTGRQLLLLRDENDLVRKKLSEWHMNATVNDAISLALHMLAVRMLRSQRKISLKDIERSMRTAFAAADLNLGLVRLLPAADLKLEPSERTYIIQLGISRGSEPHAAAAKLLGRTHRWRSFMHIPLATGKRLHGLAVLGSEAEAAFPADSHEDYALRLGELLSAVLARRS